MQNLTADGLSSTKVPSTPTETSSDDESSSSEESDYEDEIELIEQDIKEVRVTTLQARDAILRQSFCSVIC